MGIQVDRHDIRQYVFKQSPFINGRADKNFTPPTLTFTIDLFELVLLHGVLGNVI
jgi:hypothetical protein